MFYNRKVELDFLNRRFESGKAEFLVFYGRRRVGKTELLSHFCREKRAIFFVADLGSELSLLAGLSTAVNDVLFGPGAVKAVYATWEDLFHAVGNTASTERLILVLDEFPYLVNAQPALASMLQKIWDRELRNSKIMLILCGSYIGMMEETVLGYQAPLYGRRTAQYLLEPFQFSEASIFFPKFDPADQVRTYAVFGGTPAYLTLLNPDQPLAENIEDQILTRGSYLYDEVRFVLQQELREPRNYFAILQAIASGKTRLNEIKQSTGLDGATAYLDTLQQLQLIERHTPVTETQPHKSRRGLYRIKDPYVRFWFRYVLPNRSVLEQGGTAQVLADQILPEMDHFASPIFEEVCRQLLWKLPFPFAPKQIGRWWNNSAEIDLIALDERQAMLVECKFSSKPVGVDILADLEEKARQVQPELQDRRIQYGLCARSGFTPQLWELTGQRSDLHLWDLKSMLNG